MQNFFVLGTLPGPKRFELGTLSGLKLFDCGTLLGPKLFERGKLFKLHFFFFVFEFDRRSRGVSNNVFGLNPGFRQFFFNF